MAAPTEAFRTGRPLAARWPEQRKGKGKNIYLKKSHSSKESHEGGLGLIPAHFGLALAAIWKHQLVDPVVKRLRQLAWNDEKHVAHWEMIRMRPHEVPREREQIGVNRREPPHIRPPVHQKLRAFPQIALPPHALTMLLDHPQAPHPLLMHRQRLARKRVLRPRDHHITLRHPLALRLIRHRPIPVRALAGDRDLRRGARHGVGVEEDVRVQALAPKRRKDVLEDAGLDGGL
eukprot:CAMPEP_0174886418 /NCGR_PEP_ID=MMETSP0167-20121228/1647_1 /TAXON_ID=38298 /ORGANISM="Rhodella maculata, Strain CCMP736" /LENGTH=231 /DNA_ID=CAMNT_0016122405 /DNA_START=400 /DNA_END=1096 /DNA_ORIENTATION=-